jgi:glutathione S-transferase
MELFFSPLACSLASRIALYEAGLPADYTRVDGKTKRTSNGADFLAINPRGQVPTLRTAEGEVLTENIAVLEYLADLAPKAGLAPFGMERTQMRRWLGLINSELHVSALGPILSPSAPDVVKAYAEDKARKAFAHLDRHLDGNDWLTGSYTVADIYLAVVANWAQATPIRIEDYPHVKAHMKRVFARPAAAKAVGEEFEMYRAAA